MHVMMMTTRLVAGKAKNKIVVYQTVAQGSRNGSLSWSTVAALLARLTQGLFNP